MPRLTKRQKASVALADLTQAFLLKDALELLAKMPMAKFDETVEIAARLSVDPRQSDQMVRGSLKLPHGSGKKVTILAFTQNEQEALDAGAEFAGLETMIEKIQGGWLDFDVALATPDAMKEVRKIARILGPRGLMPNPKSGTVSDNLSQTIEEVRAGRVEFKMDKTANLHLIIGKRSFGVDQLVDNATAAVDAILNNKPETFKGNLIKSMSLSGTMTPGIKIHNGVFTHDNK